MTAAMLRNTLLFLSFLFATKFFGNTLSFTYQNSADAAGTTASSTSMGIRKMPLQQTGLSERNTWLY